MHHVAEMVAGPRPDFDDRAEAGRALAEFMDREGASPEVVIAVPSGGVAVAVPVAERFGAPLDVVLVRKLPLPVSPEAGFGAVTLEGELVLNEPLVERAGLTPERIEAIMEEVLEDLRRRGHAFEEVRPWASLTGRRVVLVDDGLASGVTMRAAVGEVRRTGPAALAVAAPAAPERTLRRIEPEVDEIYCLRAQGPGPFAVASFYRRWRDLTDREAVQILRESTRADGQES